MELIILLFIAIFVYTYRTNSGEFTSKFFVNKVTSIYNKYAPGNFKEVREKAKELGQEYTPRQYMTQVVLLGVFFGGIAFLYFWNLVIAVIYAVVAIMFVPYLALLRCKRIYSEYIFEQIQVYTTNTIMEFNTTQSFVKSLEGVRDSGIIEEPVLSDLKKMIDLSYENGTIEQSIDYFNQRYPFYMVKNMHQLFLQITNEGAKDSGESLENMSMDIDMLVEGVYRDRMDRKNFHKRFLSFGFVLFFLVFAMSILLGIDSYKELVSLWYVSILLHAILIINSFFLLKGEKYYNEDVGAE